VLSLTMRGPLLSSTVKLLPTVFVHWHDVNIVYNRMRTVSRHCENDRSARFHARRQPREFVGDQLRADQARCVLCDAALSQ
jgi:hypothetical protein